MKRAIQEAAIEFIFAKVVYRFGCSLEIVTDRGSHFMSGMVFELLKRMSVKHCRASSYYPQANGPVERTNRILCSIIGKMASEKQREWNLYVNSALWAYRTSYKVETKYTPFFVRFGQEAMLLIKLEIVHFGQLYDMRSVMLMLLLPHF